MMGQRFIDMVEAKWAQNHIVAVGLDSDIRSLPAHVARADRAQLEFNAAIIDATAHTACAYKINLAFYLACGIDGLEALTETVAYARKLAPDVAIILDGKFGDIGNTNEAYAHFCYEIVGVDAVTLNPYVGRQALEPFLTRSDKGAIVLCRTSNEGASEFQGLSCDHEARSDPLYLQVARAVVATWNERDNCCLVVGATAPDELKSVRAVAEGLPILIPGVGTQGGDLETTVSFGRGKDRAGVIVNASRSLIFASSGEEYAQAAGEELSRLDAEAGRYLRQGSAV